jgi:hypothetical protein
VTDEPTGAATWEDPSWRAAAIDWAAAESDRLGMEMDGEPEQPHVRPWSTVLRLRLRLRVDGGPVWLKSVGSGSAQEPPLSAALAGRVPGRVLAPLTHLGRRLTLLPDGGPADPATP